jgi:hypothetical protein
VGDCRVKCFGYIECVFECGYIGCDIIEVADDIAFPARKDFDLLIFELLGCYDILEL